MTNDSIVTILDLQYTLKLTSSDVKIAWDHCHAAAALQGIVNRDAPRIYLKYINSQTINQNVDEYWLKKITAKNSWLENAKVETAENLVSLINKFKPFLNGAVVYDPNVPATSNVASTIAGVDNLLPVRYDLSPGSLYSEIILNGPKLPVKCLLINEDGSSMFTGKNNIPGTVILSSGSAKCDAYLWMKYHYIDAGLCNAEWAGYYIDQFWMKSAGNNVKNQHCLTNHDFFISQKAFFFDLSPWGDETPNDDLEQPAGADLNTLKSLLLSAYHNGGKNKMIHIGGFVPWAYKYTSEVGGKHGGVKSEWEFGKVISAYNGFMDADAISLGAMANASFYRHFPLEDEYTQKWISEEELEKRSKHSIINSKISNQKSKDKTSDFDIKYLNTKHPTSSVKRQNLIFYAGDYDCAPWLYQKTMDIWDDPNRGKIPVMWAISPIIAARAPMAMDYLRKTATENDYFVAADNGAGYCEPGMLQEPREISGLPSGLPAWEKHCQNYYKKWGLTITGFVIYGNGPELDKNGFDCYAKFSPNGMVPILGKKAFLHNNMPVIPADYKMHTVQDDNPVDAARKIVKRIAERVDENFPPFHWFRNVLKTPTWYLETYNEIKKLDPDIELLAAPAFFESLRIYLA